MSEIVKLEAGDLKELLRFLNTSFRGDPDCMHFEKGLPKLWVDDDAHMGKHYAVKEDGKIIAVVGIYIFDAYIGNERHKFATVGNVATAVAHRGKGYLHRFYLLANEILEKEGVDVARLGGKRSRYERYGYEPCGSVYKSLITARNADEYIASNETRHYEFRKIEKEDTAALEKVRALYERNDIRANRGETLQEFYLSAIAWDMTIWGAYDNGDFAGYILTPPEMTWSPEAAAVKSEAFVGMVSRFLQFSGKDQIEVRVAPYQLEEIRSLQAVGETSRVDVPSHFKILNRQKLTEALLKLGNSLTPYPDGEVVIGVEREGNYLISVADGVPACAKTNKPADVNLGYLEAARFMYGPMPPQFTAALPKEKAGFLSSIFPLPFYWNYQDRA